MANEYYCGKCSQSTYSAATFKEHKCPTCGHKTVINPNPKEVRHAHDLAERVGFVDPIKGGKNA